MCKVNGATPSTSTASSGSSSGGNVADTKLQLPVIIAGAGPCGLVTALTLQQNQIPFVIYERASREKLCSNAGSGFDVAPTAVDILGNKLCIDMKKAMRPYDYMYMADMKGHALSTYRLEDLPNARDFGFANRADMQNALLDSLMEGKPTDEEQNAILKCGITVTGYTNQDDYVTVSLSDGTIVNGSALLACDGIHSGVRKHMHRDVDDDLSYCGQECWWGKTTIQPGSELELELKKLDNEASCKTGNCAIALLGSPKRPGSFFSCPVGENIHAWVYIVKQKNSPAANQTNDLVRRGGTVLTEEALRLELLEPISNRSKLLQLIIQDADPGVTRAGLFDRKNLDLPFVDGRVALLGDAAHPQSPMMGQGANMAIVDGYVAATRLAAAAKIDNKRSIVDTLEDFDCDIRREGINKVIADARYYGDIAVSRSRLKCWMFKTMVKFAPPSVIAKELVKGDKSNKKFVEAMDAAVNVVN